MLFRSQWGIGIKSVTHTDFSVKGTDQELYTAKIMIGVPKGTPLVAVVNELDRIFFSIAEPKEGVDELLGGSSGT